MLLGRDGDVKLIDLGFAGRITLNPMQTNCGSVSYSAPEVINGEAYDGRAADVWSLGVMLFALVCGSLPFDDSNIARVVQLINDGTYEIPDWVSDTAADLIIRLLKHRPSSRLTLDQLLEHPYFDGLEPPQCEDTTVDAKVIGLLATFYGKSERLIADELPKFGQVAADYHFVLHTLRAGRPCRLPANAGVWPYATPQQRMQQQNQQSPHHLRRPRTSSVTTSPLLPRAAPPSRAPSWRSVAFRAFGFLKPKDEVKPSVSSPLRMSSACELVIRMAVQLGVHATQLSKFMFQITAAVDAGEYRRQSTAATSAAAATTAAAAAAAAGPAATLMQEKVALSGASVSVTLSGSNDNLDAALADGSSGVGSSMDLRDAGSSRSSMDVAAFDSGVHGQSQSQQQRLSVGANSTAAAAAAQSSNKSNSGNLNKKTARSYSCGNEGRANVDVYDSAAAAAAAIAEETLVQSSPRGSVSELNAGLQEMMINPSPRGSFMADFTGALHSHRGSIMSELDSRASMQSSAVTPAADMDAAAQERTVCFTIEVTRVLVGRGCKVYFRRIAGDIWKYNSICSHFSEAIKNPEGVTSLL